MSKLWRLIHVWVDIQTVYLYQFKQSVGLPPQTQPHEWWSDQRVTLPFFFILLGLSCHNKRVPINNESCKACWINRNARLYNNLFSTYYKHVKLLFSLNGVSSNTHTKLFLFYFVVNMSEYWWKMCSHIVIHYPKSNVNSVPCTLYSTVVKVE